LQYGHIYSGRVVFIIGTSGVGKTSAIAKMVVHFTVDLRQRVGWICADTVKIGAIAEAKTYSETIGTPLRVVYSPEELGNAIENLRQEVDYIFVDTPAFNPQNEASVLEIGSILTAFPRRSTWLVIPAAAREIDLQNALGAVSPFKPRCLLLTKLDETNNFSAVYNIAWRSQLPMAYFSFGSKVMNELIPARPETLVQAIFESRFRV
jgi:flagellar biosynthesis protein FlhF